MIKKIATWAFVAFLVFFAATRPAAAATATKSIGTLLAGMATGFGDFFTKSCSARKTYGNLALHRVWH